MTPMTSTVRTLILDWTRLHNQQRLMEASLLASSALVTGGAGIAVLQRALENPLPWTPLVAPVVLASVGLGVWRYRRASKQPERMAQAVDNANRTRDLFSTALAVESGKFLGEDGCGRLVMSRALEQAPSIQANRVVPFRWPARSLVIAGLALLAATAFLILTHDRYMERLRASQLAADQLANATSPENAPPKTPAKNNSTTPP